jgi:hypothetical protein
MIPKTRWKRIWVMVGLALGAGISRGNPHAQSDAANAKASAGPVAGVLSGTVKDRHTGAPLTGAWVFLNEKSTNKPPTFDSALTGADGGYRFTGLQPIAESAFGYIVRVKKSRYGISVSSLIQLQSGEEKIHDVELEKIVSLTVTVSDSAGAGAPLTGAHVGLKLDYKARADLFEPGYNVLTGETDSSGRVRFEGAWPGGMDLTVAFKGYRTRYLRDSLEGRVFEESLTVSLVKEAPTVSKTIIGTKKTVSGKIIRGEQVHFMCAVPEGKFILYDAAWKDLRPPAADSGLFTIEGIPEGCAAGMLRTRYDSASAVLTGTETRLIFTIKDPPVNAALRKPPSERRFSQGVRVGLGVYTLTGRRMPAETGTAGAGTAKSEISAVRAPRRP